MNAKKQALLSIQQTARKEQIQIRAMLNAVMHPELRSALEDQLRELGEIEGESYSIASCRGWELPEEEVGRQAFCNFTAGFRLRRGNTDSKIAEAIIRSQTNGMIRALKSVRNVRQGDRRIDILCRKLLDCQTASILKMQSFLQNRD